MTRESKWIVALIQQIRVRPAMYLWSANVHALGTYLSGFSRGRDSVGGEVGGEEYRILFEFAGWLCPNESFMKYRGWVDPVLREAERAGRADALTFFFEKFEEFCVHTGLAPMCELSLAGNFWGDVE